MQFKSTVLKAICLLFHFHFGQNVFAQKFSETLVIGENRVWLADTLIARFIRWDNFDAGISGNSRKELAVVFEHK